MKERKVKRWAAGGLAIGFVVLAGVRVSAQEQEKKPQEKTPTPIQQQALSTYDKAFAAQLAKQLKAKEARVRADAATWLGMMKATEYAEDLASLVKDEDADVRERTVWALGAMKAKEHARDVVELLKDKTADVREAAVQALDTMEAKECADKLIAVLGDTTRPSC